jgi:hypothetical protein
MSFQPVQDGVFAAGEFLPTGLAFEILNLFLLAMAAVANRAWILSSVIPKYSQSEFGQE